MTTTTKRAIAAKMLHNAYLHLSATRKFGTVERAQTLLMDAERRVRNGFGPASYDHYNFDSLNWNSTENLYKSDSISVA